MNLVTKVALNMKLIGIDESFIVMFGSEQNEQSHRHYGIQLLIPMNEIDINGVTTQSLVLINSFVDHMGQGKGDILSILFNPESHIGRRIKRFFFEQESIVFFQHPHISTRAKLISKDYQEFERVTYMIIEQFMMDVPHVPQIDDRVAEMNEYIKGSKFEHLRYDDVLDCVFLSKSRLTHLFKDEMGIPLMKYITWKRLLHTSIQLATSHMTITNAAHQYGFADAAHFSRVFKDHFGISPRDIFQKQLKDSCLVHVFVTDSK